MKRYFITEDVEMASKCMKDVKITSYQGNARPQ